MKMYEVGGCVRDEILGLKSKDIDFSVELSAEDLRFNKIVSDDTDPFIIMVNELKDRGFTIFAETPDFFVAKGKFPKRGFEKYDGLVADFVLARKESTYSDGRRPDKVEVGTLLDDLSRRDFTMNAIAKDFDGSYIDPFNGQQDIAAQVIVAVGDPMVRLNEDALRAMRALRFSVTKGFAIDPELAFAMQTVAVTEALRTIISKERIAEELSKMFRWDTLASLEALRQFPSLTRAVMSKVSLDASLKTKNVGKQ